MLPYPTLTAVLGHLFKAKTNLSSTVAALMILRVRETKLTEITLALCTTKISEQKLYMVKTFSDCKNDHWASFALHCVLALPDLPHAHVPFKHSPIVFLAN